MDLLVDSSTRIGAATARKFETVPAILQCLSDINIVKKVMSM